MFTIGETQHSESSKHNLTKQQCHLDIARLMDVRMTDPPFIVDKDTLERWTVRDSQLFYVCVPTSYK